MFKCLICHKTLPNEFWASNGFQHPVCKVCKWESMQPECIKRDFPNLEEMARTQRVYEKDMN